MTDKKNHLWIPEQEIKHIDKTPTGRGNDYPVQPHEHGEKLSRGLRDIMKFFQHIQSPGPLDEKDLIAFLCEEVHGQCDCMEHALSIYHLLLRNIPAMFHPDKLPDFRKHCRVSCISGNCQIGFPLKGLLYHR